MFVNEYIMNRKRYDKWAAPKFWRLRSFYVYLIIFIAGIFGWIYFDRVGASARWQTIGAFLVFVSVYRAYFSLDARRQDLPSYPAEIFQRKRLGLQGYPKR